MTKKDFRILFMGTPAFAVETLRSLVENRYNVVGVVTMPDKPAGRGYKVQQSDVKKYALSQNLPILQPEKLRDEDFLNDLKSLQAHVNIVVAFRMLPKVVWSIPEFGTYNLHASLLPQYRGAAPINWAIINGEKETGVTTFKLIHEIDSGKIAYQSKIKIGENDNAGIIHDKLMVSGAQLMLKTVDSLIDESIVLQAQEAESKSLKPAPKIFKETCRINWGSTVETIHNFIRGLSPYPAAHTQLKRKDESINIKLFKARPIIKSHYFAPGSIVQPDSTQLYVAGQDGYIEILELQLQGRKRLKTSDFLNGFPLNKTDYFKLF